MEEMDKDIDEEIGLEDDDVVCPNCGQSTEGQTTCPYCGAILSNDDDLEDFEDEEM